MATTSPKSAVDKAIDAAPASEKPEAKAKPSKAKAAATADPLIKTVSEFSELSPADRQAFRLAGGTVTNDPA